MLRVKDIVRNQTQITESDVVRRNPLQPSYRKEHYDSRDKVVVQDLEDDIDTLDGRINARGRADEVRRSRVDAARRLNNKAEIYSKYAPILRELVKKLDSEGEWRLSKDAESLLSHLGDIVPSDYEVSKANRDARERIIVGDVEYY